MSKQEFIQLITNLSISQITEFEIKYEDYAATINSKKINFKED